MSLSRFYFQGNLNEGETVCLSGELAHYLGTVLRKKKNDEIILFNGQSCDQSLVYEYKAHIQNIN